MKSNYLTKGTNEKVVVINQEIRKLGLTQEPSLAKLKPTIRRIILEDFQTLREDNEDKNVLEILEYMLSADYASYITPTTKKVKTCITSCVNDLINKEAEKAIESWKNEKNVSIKKQFENIKFIERLQELLGRSISSRNKDLIDEFYADKQNELDFFKTAQEFTNNFDFLLEDSLAYSARTGVRNTIKFKDFRFYNLRTVLKFYYDKSEDELTAIKALKNALLQDKRKDKTGIYLSMAEYRILQAREKVLIRQKEERNTQER